MKKKLILIGSVSITVIAAAALILFFVLTKDTIREEEIVESKEKSPDTTQSYTLSEKEILASGEKCIAAKSGLNLRSSPNKSSKVISLILFGAKVTINKSEGDEIFLDGRYGKWVNVKHGNKTGWLFSGFLCDFKPDIVIKYVADFYRDQYRKHKWYSENKEYTHFKDSKVSIKYIIDNYIVLGIPTGHGIGNFVWKYDGEKKLLFEAFNIGLGLFNSTYLFYLDDDRYPDLVVIHGCCSGLDMDILLGSEDGFIEMKILSTPCYGYSYIVEGSCKDMVFACQLVHDFDQPTEYCTMAYMRFNCKKKEFEGYAEGKIIESKGTIKSIDLKNMSIVIKDKKNLEETSYKISGRYKFNVSTHSDEDINNLKKKLGKEISFDYVTIDDTKIFLGER